MAVRGESEQRQSLWRRALRGTFLLLFALLAVTGSLAILLELYSWHLGKRWGPEDINAVISANSPTRQLAKAAWDDVKFLIQYGAYLIAAIAFAIAITQIKTVARLIRDFIEARGPIYELGSTITKVEAQVSALSETGDRLSKMEPTIKEIAEKIEGTYAQIASLQRLAVSERTEASPEELPSDAVNGSGMQAAQAPTEDRNWERLRELWNANGERLDEVIESVSDKRRRSRFQRMPRTNYPAIIDALAEARLISEPAREASLKLHSVFMSYKPRNRRIPDAAIAAMEVLDRMLQLELRPQPDDGPPTRTVDTAAAPSV